MNYTSGVQTTNMLILLNPKSSRYNKDTTRAVMNPHDYENIRPVQVELTANCNARVPACDRWIDKKESRKTGLEEGAINPFKDPLGSKGHMKMEAFANLFTGNFTPRLNVVEYNGTWGDFMLQLHDVFKFTEYLTTVKGPTTGWEVATHGGLTQ